MGGQFLLERDLPEPAKSSFQSSTQMGWDVSPRRSLMPNGRRRPGGILAKRWMLWEMKSVRKIVRAKRRVILMPVPHSTGVEACWRARPNTSNFARKTQSGASWYNGVSLPMNGLIWALTLPYEGSRSVMLQWVLLTVERLDLWHLLTLPYSVQGEAYTYLLTASSPSSSRFQNFNGEEIGLSINDAQ